MLGCKSQDGVSPPREQGNPEPPHDSVDRGHGAAPPALSASIPREPTSSMAGAQSTASAATSLKCRAPRNDVLRTLVVRTTFGWGCPCPHFAVPAPRSPDPTDRFLYPVFAPGVSDAVRHWVTGSFRLVGRYTGACRTYVEWKKNRGESAVLDEGRDNDPQPVFFVESWCYQPSRPPREFDMSADEIRKYAVPVCK